MNRFEYNVALLPAEQLATKAIDASAKLSQQGSLFTLQGGTYFPHVSLYMVKLKADSLESAKYALARIANTLQTVELVATEYHQAKGYFDASYEKPDSLSAVQMQVVNALNPLRDGLRKNDIARLPDATGKQLENYQKYGWNSIGELYRPHLTLTRFTDEQTEPTDLPEVTNFSGQFTKLGLFNLGDNGTCVREIASWALK